MLINLSNHPFAKWGARQTETARRLYGEVRDMPFPVVDPQASPWQVAVLAANYFRQIVLIFQKQQEDGQPNAVHVQGEFTFVYRLVTLLKERGITCLASTATRNVKELDNREKVVKFEFVRFREY